MTEPNMVQVSYGPTNKTISPGKTIRDAAKAVEVKRRWFGARKPIVHVNGKRVDDWNTVLKAGQRVEFTKSTGEKG